MVAEAKGSWTFGLACVMESNRNSAKGTILPYVTGTSTVDKGKCGLV